jgi:hypothetical protein
LQDLLAAWQPYALYHAWKMPDGFDVKVKVMDKTEARIEVDELDHATFTYEYYENMGIKKGISLPANVTHSVDAYILRSMHRRCNYDAGVLAVAMDCIQFALTNPQPRKEVDYGSKLGYYIAQYERSGIADIVILPHIQFYNVDQLSAQHMQALFTIMQGMLQYQPFDLVTVHDEFKAHANHINWVRWQYKEIMAELADSNLLSDILSQIHGKQGTFPKLSAPGELAKLIRNSNYALT